jgi:hypothetical protein
MQALLWKAVKMTPHPRVPSSCCMLKATANYMVIKY